MAEKVVAFIGDSITAGYLSSDWETTSYVSLVRSALQTTYGNGGEGFMSVLHREFPVTAGGSNTNRWSNTGFTYSYANSKTGFGANAGNAYANASNANLSMSVTGGTRVGVVHARNHNIALSSGMPVKINGSSAGTCDVRGDGVIANLRYGNVTWFELPDPGTHTVAVGPGDGSGTGYIFTEGFIVDNETQGIRIDRYGKGWMQANWLGNVNESAPETDFFDVLRAPTRIGADLWVVALSVNDYLTQVALATYEAALGVIVQRLKAFGDVLLLCMPQPNSSLTIPYSSYRQRMLDVGTAYNVSTVDIWNEWGGVFVSGRMADDNHPNDTGHDLIADSLIAAIPAYFPAVGGAGVASFHSFSPMGIY